MSRSRPLPDAVVIGAGVIGASCAFHLARAGVRVTVIDRADGPGTGSTARATGGFRASFATAIDVRLSLLARDRLRAFHAETGVDPGIAEVGYLWLASSAAALDALRAAREVQRAAGAPATSIVGADDIRAIQPAVEVAGVVGGAWCPHDGTLRPDELQRGYLEAAGRLGAEVRWSEPVVELARAGDRITAVVTPRGAIATGVVVNAAGAWAAAVAALAGVALPVVPLRRQVAVTEPTTRLPLTSPLTIWAEDGFHLRVRDDRVLLLHPSPGDPDDPWATTVEPAWLDAIAAHAAARVPALRGVALDRGRAWAGLYEMTPDHHAIVGLDPATGLLAVNGSSGHGVMHAPALGALAAELVAGTPSLDLAPLRPDRFASAPPTPPAPPL